MIPEQSVEITGPWHMEPFERSKEIARVARSIGFDIDTRFDADSMGYVVTLVPV